MIATLVALGLAGVAAATSSPRTTVTVHLIDRCVAPSPCLPERIVTRLKREAERIWSLLDVQISWIDSIDARPPAHPAGVTVMLEEGV